ncbi:MAG: LytR/AlgR family response regulator transcription factor [Flavisolibacter sp.]
MTCIIVEDIQMAADILKRFCEKSGLVQVEGHFLNVSDALSFLDDNKVDLIFLDVEMPGATGFDLLDNLTFKPKIILTTSKTEYAFNAFQYNVDDYLKKPFTYKRFIESVEKIQKAEPEKASTPAKETSDHLFIKVDTKLVKLMNNDILYVESMGDYVKFVTGSKKLVTLNTLKNLEEKLSRSTFMKVHRSYIVNISKIDDLQGNIIYIQGNEVPIGKGHREEVLKRLNIV